MITCDYGRYVDRNMDRAVCGVVVSRRVVDFWGKCVCWSDGWCICKMYARLGQSQLFRESNHDRYLTASTLTSDLCTPYFSSRFPIRETFLPLPSKTAGFIHVTNNTLNPPHRLSKRVSRRTMLLDDSNLKRSVGLPFTDVEDQV